MEIAQQALAGLEGMMAGLANLANVPLGEGGQEETPEKDCAVRVARCIATCDRGRTQQIFESAKDLSMIDIILPFDLFYFKCTQPCEEARKKCLAIQRKKEDKSIKDEAKAEAEGKVPAGE